MIAMSQKIIQIGSSYGVTISPDILDQLGWQHGSRVEIQVDDKKGILKIIPSKDISIKIVRGRAVRTIQKKKR